MTNIPISTTSVIPGYNTNDYVESIYADAGSSPDALDELVAKARQKNANGIVMYTNVRDDSRVYVGGTAVIVVPV